MDRCSAFKATNTTGVPSSKSGPCPIEQTALQGACAGLSIRSQLGQLGVTPLPVNQRNVFSLAVRSTLSLI